MVLQLLLPGLGGLGETMGDNWQVINYRWGTTLDKQLQHVDWLNELPGAQLKHNSRTYVYLIFTNMQFHLQRQPQIRVSGTYKTNYAAGNGEKFGIAAVDASPNRIKVFCDLESDEFFGWTVIMQRVKLDEDFNRTWKEYKHGFGNVTKGQDFWLGKIIVKVGSKSAEGLEFKSHHSPILAPSTSTQAEHIGYQLGSEQWEHATIELFRNSNWTVKLANLPNISANHSQNEKR